MSDRGLTLGKEYDIVAKQTSKLLVNIQPKVETIYEDLVDTGFRMGTTLLAAIGGETDPGKLQTLLEPTIDFPNKA